MGDDTVAFGQSRSDPYNPLGILEPSISLAITHIDPNRWFCAIEGGRGPVAAAFGSRSPIAPAVRSELDVENSGVTIIYLVARSGRY